MAQQTTTYEKLDQLLVLCNDIIEEILARRVEATDILEVSENHGLECLSTHIHDEDRINNIKKELKKLDDTINNKL
jgi:23S rRNA U2552 (ribose-2'-O)-methylase RlmE/FtsJ